MPEVITCPKCKRRSRVPEKFLGKKVKCPGCETVFLAATAPAPARPDARKPRAGADGGDDYEVVEDTKPARRRADDDDEEERISEGPRKKRPADEDDEDDERVSERPTKRRPPAEEDDEEDDRPRRPRRSRIDDDEDDEDEAPRRRAPEWKKKKKKRRRSTSLGLGGLSTTLMIALGGVGICLVLSVVAIFVPAVALVPIVLGGLISFAGSLLILVIAFQDSAVQGLLCLCVPFYSLVYIIMNFEECKTALLVWVTGLGILAMGYCGGGIGAARHAEPLPNQPPPGFQFPAK